VAIMPELIAKLEQFGELRLKASTKEKLLRISAATVDRLLQAEPRKAVAPACAYQARHFTQTPDPDSHLRRVG